MAKAETGQGSRPPARSALVTGATDGIGRAIAVGLAARGFDVVVHGRNQAKIDAVVGQIRRMGAGRPTSLQADLSHLDDVRRAAGEVVESVPRLDALVNNAGVLCERRRVSPDGFELTIVTNYLSHFLLTELLRPQLVPGGVVVNVSSKAQASGRIRLDDLSLEEGWSGTAAYCQSKLAQVMHAMTLAETQGLRAYSLHPGVVRSKVLDALETELVRHHQISAPMECVSADEGASSVIALVTGEADASNGAYLDEGTETRPAPEASDAELRQALWKESRRLVGLGPE